MRPILPTLQRAFYLAATAAVAMALASAGCDAQTSKAIAPGDASFDARVHAYLLAHPEVVAEALDQLQANQAALKAASAQTAITQHRQALEHDPRDGVAGNANGALTVVEFFDYRCPFCKAAQPELAKLLQSHRNVRLVLKEFPILDAEDQSHTSEDASRAALGSMPQGKYLEVHDALLAQSHLDEDGVQRVLASLGVQGGPEATIAASKAVTDHLAANRDLAREIGVDGTPAFVVGGKMIAGAQLEALEDAIADAPKR